MWWDCLSQTMHQWHSLAVGHRRRCDETFLLSQNVQCNSQTVGHHKRCDETTFHKICIVTHKLLVIGKCVMRLPYTKLCAMSLPAAHRKRCDETAFHKNCKVAHSLLVLWKDVMNRETAFHEMWNATHLLLIIGKNVMRLPFTTWAMSHTSSSWWS